MSSLSRSSRRNSNRKALWAKEDEILLLKSMVHYEVVLQCNPYTHMRECFDYVEDSLHFKVRRKQFTDKLWKLRKKFLDSKYDPANGHHANLLEYAKLIPSWGQHANVSLDGQNIATNDDQNVKEDIVNVDQLSKWVVKPEKRGRLVSSDGQNGKKGKCSKKKGKVVNINGLSNKKDVMVAEDVDAGKAEQVVKDKRKRDDSTFDDQYVEQVSVVDNVDKLSKVGKSEKKGRINMTLGDQNGKRNNVVIDNYVCVNKVSELVKKKKNKKLVSRYVENVKQTFLVVDGASDGKYSEKKGRFGFSDGQDDEEEDMVAGDVDTDNVLTRDDQNVEVIANVVVDDVQSPKKNFKKRVKIIGGKNVLTEVKRENSKDFTSMFPELSSMLELETPYKMSQHIKKRFVMDTINSLGWEKAYELEKEWDDVRLSEMKLKSKQLDLKIKEKNLILGAVRREFKV